MRSGGALFDILDSSVKAIARRNFHLLYLSIVVNINSLSAISTRIASLRILSRAIATGIPRSSGFHEQYAKIKHFSRVPKMEPEEIPGFSRRSHAAFS